MRQETSFHCYRAAVWDYKTVRCNQIHLAFHPLDRDRFAAWFVLAWVVRRSFQQLRYRDSYRDDSCWLPDCYPLNNFAIHRWYIACLGPSEPSPSPLADGAIGPLSEHPSRQRLWFVIASTNRRFAESRGPLPRLNTTNLRKYGCTWYPSPRSG